jgi:hypothetical protein
LAVRRLGGGYTPERER